MNLRFQHIEFVWGLALVPACIVLFILLLRWKKNVVRKMGDKKLVGVLTNNFSPRLFYLKFILLLLALVAGVITIMNLRRPADSDSLSRKGIDVVIAMDVSKSMLARDLQPSRLERAKQFVTRLMNEMPNDRIALVFFAGKAYMQMPLTTDHSAAQLFISAAGPDAVPQQGTVISEALKMSAKAFNNTDRRFKAVVLLSDGEDHDPEADKTSRDLAEEGMMINTVGIGSPEGANIIDPATGENKKDELGNTVITKLNEDELRLIADNTNGVYVRLQSSDDAVAAIKKNLSQIETRALGDVSLMNFKTYYWWFAGAMLIFLLVEFFIPERKKALA
ncbi:MAG TPA: VWA domain-containing protein [Chitinophagaceae bacterium]|nr:VWA domain-containing protein [Chitinophagaceae bacterium]